MGKRDRNTLKKPFEQGCLPSQENFHDLIDSTLNLIDEGFSRSKDYGIEIVALDERGRLLSFLRDREQGHRWLVSYDRERDALVVTAQSGLSEDGTASLDAPPVLAVAPPGRIGINEGAPARELDVNGVIRSRGRIGRWTPGGPGSEDGQESVPADGKYYDITGPLTGCHAFEIMAGAAATKGEGHYALLHGWAMNTFHPRGLFFNFLNRKRRIKEHHAYYRSRGDKLKLKWCSAGNARPGKRSPYCLKLKSNRDYGKPGFRIRYHITKLWFDEDNLESPTATESANGSEGVGEEPGGGQ